MRWITLLGTFLIFLGSSCTTFGGTSDSGNIGDDAGLPAAGLSEDRTAADPRSGGFISVTDQSSDEEGLRITSEPEYASVYINGQFYGNTPLTVAELPADRYSIEVRAEGYYSRTAVIDYSGTARQELYFSLQRITGYLSINTNVASVVHISGKPVQLPAERIRIPSGSYKLQVQAFGYSPEYIDVEINRNSDLQFNIDLKRADFSLNSVTLARERINPNSTGIFSNLEGSFRVTAPGTADLHIVDTDGNIQYTAALGPFESWKQIFTVSAGSLQDLKLQDGTYTLLISAIGTDGTETTEEREFNIDSSLKISASSLIQGTSGPIFAPDAAILPVGTIQASTFFSGRFYSSDDESSLVLPAGLSVRYAVVENLEISSAVEGIFLNTLSGELPYAVSAGLKTVLHRFGTFMSTGAYGRLSFGQNDNTDYFTNFPGIHAGIPVTLTSGSDRFSVSYSVTPEVAASWTHPEEPTDTPETAFYSWGYLRTALSIEYSFIQTALSFSLRSAPFSEGFDLGYMPFAAGFEMHAIPSSSGTVFSIYLSGQGEDINAFSLAGGAGIGILF